MTKHRKADLQGRMHFDQDFPNYFIVEDTEDDYNVIDRFLTARTPSAPTYALEIKDETNNGHYRPYSKFTFNGKDYGFQVDLAKVEGVVEYCNQEGQGRRPLLYVRFGDITLVWKLDEVPYNDRKRQVWTNKNGMNYGAEKELTWQTYLYRKEAKWEKPTVS